MSLSLCDHCEFAKPKPSYCLDCPFVFTCGRTLPGRMSNRHCPHLDQEYINEMGMSEGVVKNCPNYKEVRW